jgi:hypothetical protein
LKIEIAKPPNYDEILKVFPKAGDYGVIFAYGDTIFNPSGVEISPPLMAHEEVHGRRQRGGICDPDVEPVRIWWGEYLADPEFRYREEILAHAAEFRVQMPRDRNLRAQLAINTARRLIAPLYNYGISKTLVQGVRDLEKALASK